jgi:hypothetical protein
MTSYPLLEALLHRRSRRFGKGMKLEGGPLAYTSAQAPEPLTVEEEAALAFAACGITGYALAELPFAAAPASATGAGGNIMTHFVGRTAASGDAMHDVAVFVINDQGAWMLRRPQDFPRAEIPALIQAARERRLVDLYEKGRVRISERRPDVPRELPYVPPFNQWTANAPGTTYFLPVGEMTALYINVVLSAFSEDFAYFVVDERNRFRPAGIGRFGRSRGGILRDDPKDGRVATVGGLETWIAEFVAIEHGAVLQNLGLMTQALGLGGFPHFAAHPYIWLEALGFQMEHVPLSRLAGAGELQALVMGLLGKDVRVPSAVGLERRGEVLIRPYCPPYYRSMREAVEAFVAYKYAAGKGTMRDGGAVTGWRDGAAVQAGIPPYSDRTVEAAIAYCEYIYRRYGRFPALCGPFRTILAYQAHRLDLGFYERFYREEALSDAQRRRP